MFKHLLKFMDNLKDKLSRNQYDVQHLLRIYKLRIKPRSLSIRGVSPREDCTKNEEYVKDMQNILSIESHKSSQEKTKVQALSKGKSY